MFCDMIDQIIDFNKSFVEQKGYEKYLTDKYPDKKLAVLSCMDTRLTELNDEVSTLITDRTNQVADKKAMQQRQKRKEAEARWRTFVVVLNAAAVMDADEHRYETLIGQLNQRLKEMKQQMRHKRRMNPRKKENSALAAASASSN